MNFRFAEFKLDTRDFKLFVDEQPQALEPKVYDLLLYLIEHRDRVVSKEELIEAIWDGRIITDSALNTCIRSVRKALGDDRSRQKFVRTFPKRGFQFVAEVEIESEPGISDSGAEQLQFNNGAPEATATNRPDHKQSVSLSPKSVMWAGILLLSALALYLVGFLFQDESYPEKPSIAVLEFEQSFSNEQQRYFTEGLVEELVASLANFRELFVISRNSSRLYQSRNDDVETIGKELGARYLVDGTVHYNGENIQVSTRLIDSQTGQQVWSERFEREQQAVYTLQADLAGLIAGQVVPELVRSDNDRNAKKVPENLDAWALYHKARNKQSIYQAETQREAIEFALLALDKDPGLASAHGVIARAKGTQFFFEWTDNPELILQEAISHARQAIELDKYDPGAYAALGYVYRYTGDETSAIANLKRASDLNPSDATIQLEYAHTLDWFRQQELALPVINQALRLSPRDPKLESMLFYKSHIQFHLKQFEDSLVTTDAMSGAITNNTWRVFYHLIRAANLASLGERASALKDIGAALTINPALSITALRKRFEGSRNHPENRRIWLETLELAGLPQ